MKNIILFILFCGLTMFGQNLRLGFDLEAFQVRVKTPNDEVIMGGNGSPLSYHLNLALNINDNFILLSKVGKTLSVEFGGWELGLNIAYKIYEPIFIRAGVLHHSNEGGGSDTFGGTYASIFMVYFGAGVDIADFFSVGLDYYIPTAKKIILWSGWVPNTFEKMIRLGFNFG